MSEAKSNCNEEGGVDNYMSRCITVVYTDDTRVIYDESTAVSKLYYHSLTAKDIIRGDL